MKPSWATDEYPSTRRDSVVVNAIADPYRIEPSASTSIRSWKCAEASGKIGSTTRRKP